ncbi:MAG: DUF47 domain-containing protein [Chloroflexota bacterium]
MRFSFLPREPKFFDMLEESSQNMVAASQVMAALVDDWTDTEHKIALIEDLEHRGDSITHKIIGELHRTFVTPIDREDIALLANALDDIVDFVQAACDAMLVYKISRPTERSRELARILVEAATEVDQAINLLRQRNKLRQILVHCVETNRLENQADDVVRSALAELFEHTENIPDIIKWREIYEHMESASDRCEDVANVLEGVVLKYA